MTLAKALMIQGTGSGVGKSVLAAAFCRIYRARGWRVAPFKAQNMSNNSHVTDEGGEIARAQAMQAECAGAEASVHMNPILLKPHSETGSQVVVQGRPIGHMNTARFYRHRPETVRRIKQSLAWLRQRYELLILEGAGSPAEVNLRKQDLANMRTARWAGAPVLLVGDIEKGGVFASLYGTYRLLQPADRRRVAGFIINKFRGDARLLESGLDFLKRKTGVPVLGVVPYLEGLYLDEEDTLDLKTSGKSGSYDIAVARLPRISNFTDLRPLRLEPRLSVRYFSSRGEFGNPDLVILPGTKSTAHDLEFLRNRGLDRVLREYAARGGKILGLCGGFQMLGRSIEDAGGVESRRARLRGLGLLPFTTFFRPDKITRKTRARVRMKIGSRLLDESVEGYEIRMGRSAEIAANGPVLHRKGNVYGTYLHGLFDSDSFRRNFLAAVMDAPSLRNGGGRPGHRKSKEDSYSRLARHVRKALDFKYLDGLLGC
ncbi:MAG: cobyric acid synthase [Candidatus Omnitrophica bacterium]|nr:cobyric acid synthase [Candidatus Omnitrophota bacterium]